MANKTRIIFRADGNNKIGLGHVVRSMALAAMLRDEFECVFAIQAPSAELRELLQQTCHGVIMLPASPPTEDRFIHELAAYIAPDVVVVLDGYSFDTAYQQSIKSKGCPLICLDDIHAYPFVADAVLNQAGGVTKDAYRTAPYTQLLLGPKYALLRQPFLQAASQARNFPADKVRVLLNMGGADPENHTLQVAKELVRLKSITQVEIVVGGAYKHVVELQRWLKKHPAFALHQNLAADAMCRLMQQCPVAVTSASGVAQEYAAVGGALFILQTAENQQAFYTFLTASGIAHPYESFASLKTEDLRPAFGAQLQVQRQYYDGQSDVRLQQVFHSFRLRTLTTLRKVSEEDMHLLYEWNNDPEVRRRSFNPAPIPLENHRQWFHVKLADPNCIIYLAVVNGDPVAQIRFDIKGDTATISYLISKAYRGQGLGHTVLLKGVEQLRKERADIQEIEGLVQLDNTASVRAFEKAGFTNGPASEQHPEAHRFVLGLVPPQEV
ncbi:UDP-2,4-diacetamido-2,4,6-trideoxy-beta-L-altropyranose hydrolase [Pontibacter liquoris]|uniref:UDP-2,4-diacetamido-2,4, 6-trideoxy-beta-L-altropyranose hydrolase n=1 Tax=Pontibacter liquoris TaxID=2905677 RepID=UPI001FA806C3|nr:UDP-2,4-diacetamido-2,4,6-trideoxy-beta-L-altropyranose hydrolase [Pontibacter liquoris]